MTSPHGEAIRMVWVDLAEQMDPRHGVLDYLHKNQNKSGICIDSYEEICNLPTRLLRAQRLLIFVEKKKCPLELFCEALKYGDTHPHLALKLENAISTCQSSQTAPDTVDRETDQVHGLMEIDEAYVSPERSTNLLLQGSVSAVFGTRLGSMLIEMVKMKTEGSMFPERKHTFPEISSNTPVSMPMVPAKISVLREIRGSARIVYRDMQMIWHGRWNVTKLQKESIVMKISNDDGVSRDPNVRFLAALFNDLFKWNFDSLRGIDAMAEYFRHTINPTVSLVLYLTMKGRKALDEGKIDEAKGILESAQDNTSLLEPSLGTLFFLRVFSILKQRLYQRNGDPRHWEEYRLVLARAGEMSAGFLFGEANKGLLSVIHWHRARAYLGYHPDSTPLFADGVDGEDIEAACHAICQVEDGLASLGLDPNQFGAHCLVKAGIAFRKGEVADASAWAKKVREAGYASALTIHRARRVQASLEQAATPSLRAEMEVHGRA